MASDPPKRDRGSSPPPYTKYRARRGPFGGHGDRTDDRAQPARGGTAEPRPYTVHKAGGGGSRRPSWLRLPGGGSWSAGKVVTRLLMAVVGWVLLSGVIFLISALVHRSDVGEGLAGRGFPPVSPTTVLLLGSDQRPEGSKEPGARSDGAPRADSILLMRVGGGHNARLSIPRDTVVDIPGRGPNKINAAFAFGGAGLMAQTIRESLGIPVDHVIQVSFANFPGLIDAMGGVDYTGGCVVSKINGGFRNGGYTLRLKAGTTRLDGKQALALARTRKNACNKDESDLTRAGRQQKLFSAMKSRLLSPGAFVRLPLIAWSVPGAIRSDMGGPTLLGLVGGLATSGTPAARILRPTGQTTLPDGGAGLTVSPAARQRAAARFERE